MGVGANKYVTEASQRLEIPTGLQKFGRAIRNIFRDPDVVAREKEQAEIERLVAKSTERIRSGEAARSIVDNIEKMIEKGANLSDVFPENDPGNPLLDLYRKDEERPVDEEQFKEERE